MRFDGYAGVILLLKTLRCQPDDLPAEPQKHCLKKAPEILTFLDDIMAVAWPGSQVPQTWEDVRH